MKLKNIISISGGICSGKSFAAKLIAKKFGFTYISFGQYLLEYCLKNSLDIDRKTLQEVGDRLVKQNSLQFLMDVLDHFASNTESIILDGVRHKSILDAIVLLTDNKISIFMDADLKTRSKRCYKRNKQSDDFSTYELFMTSNNHRVEVETESLKFYCDIIVDSTKNYKTHLFNQINIYLKIKK